MRNFVNEAVMGKYVIDNIGQYPWDIWDEFIEWWNNLKEMIKYAIVAGVGIIAIVLVFSMMAPTNAGVAGVERLEELMRLKMMAELAE
ncbi:unnamed protein product [marine sediment metagenome]|uniref:Uncharacterized protein n=1 Tax=marine sediment metagenome TaxID=412755 RepID=X1V3N7_9ZZZZ